MDANIQSVIWRSHRLVIGVAVILAVSCGPSEQPRQGSNANETRDVVRRYFEDVLNKGDLAAVDQMLNPEFTLYAPPSLAPEPLRGTDAFKQVVSQLRVTFPDLHFTIDDEVVEHDTAAVFWTMRGTHSDLWLGVPATGKELTMTGVDLFKLAAGRIQVVRIQGDYLGALRQLGAVPSGP